jgi:alpha-glucosidase
MSKDPAYPPLPPGWQPGDPAPYSDREQVHDTYRQWAKILASYPGDRLGVVEAWGSANVLAPYLRPDEMPQAFAMDPLFWPLNARAWRTGVDTLLAATAAHGRLPTWVHGSHDISRAATRWGAAGSAAVLLLMLALPGAVYLYGGDELGLPDVDLADDDIRDPVFRRSGGTDRGRDACRVPLPWNPPRPSWLPQPPGWARYAAPGNPMLALTRRALAERNRLWRGRPGEVSWLDTPPGVLAFQRNAGPVCLTNLSGAPTTWRPYGDSVLLGSVEVAEAVPPDVTVWLANGFGMESSSSRV